MYSFEVFFDCWLNSEILWRVKAMVVFPQGYQTFDLQDAHTFLEVGDDVGVR